MAKKKSSDNYKQQQIAVVKKINDLMQEQAENGIKDPKTILKITASETGVSINIVKHIILTYEVTFIFKPPAVEPIENLNCLDQGFIIRFVHNFHDTYGGVPTVEKVRNMLKKKINFHGTEESLKQILETLGFKLVKTEGIIYIAETIKTHIERIEYIQNIKKFREDARPIIYVDESSIGIPHSNGERIVVLHAGSTTGFLPKTLLTFKVDCSNGKNSKHVNIDTYENWVRNCLIPNLPDNSVVVFENLWYYNNQYDIVPSLLSTTSEMKSWLDKKGISYPGQFQLFDIIKKNKHQDNVIKIKQILTRKSYDCRQLPPYHSDLSPIKAAWVSIEKDIISKCVSWDAEEIKKLVESKIKLMSIGDWEGIQQKLEDIEIQYSTSIYGMDLKPEDFKVISDVYSELQFLESDDENSDLTDSDVDNFLLTET